VRQVLECRQAVIDDPVGLVSLEVHDEAHATRVMLVLR
jgi:hypothetical protein